MNKIEKISRWLSFLAPRRLGGRFFNILAPLEAEHNNKYSEKKSHLPLTGLAKKRPQATEQTPDWETMPKLMSIRSTADLLDVHPNTLRKWDQQGRLPAVRLGTRQDRRYERHRVKELWHAAQPVLSDSFITQVTRPQNTRFLFRHRWFRPLLASAAAVAAIIVVSKMNWVVASQPVPSSVTFSARDCSGWQGARRAEKIDLPDGASWSEFNSRNAVRYDVNKYRVTSTADKNISTGNLDSPDPIFQCAGFTSDNFPSTGVVSRATLILSLAGQAVGNKADGFILETSPDGIIWTVRGIIPVKTENTERITYDLGTDFDRNALRSLHVRVSPDIDIATPDVQVWMDGVAIQADITTPVAVDEKKNSQAARELNKLIAFSQATYTSTETPVVTVPKIETKKLLFVTTKKLNWTLNEVTLVDSKNNITTPQFTTSDTASGSNVSTSVNFQTIGLHPGKYIVKVAMRNSDGGEATIEKEFLWGVVAMNFDRPAPRPGDVETVGLAILDDGGGTICNASIQAKLTDPNGQTTNYSTDDQTIETNDECVDKGVTNEPDYHWAFTPTAEGVYHFAVKSKTAFGERSLEENITVSASTQFDVQRADYPTRIYPPATYPVRIAVTSLQNYQGIVREEVPADFTITDILPTATIRPSVDNPDRNIIEWEVNWEQGVTYFLGYTFDAPDISPALFLIGPLSIGGSFLDTSLFLEPRSWQIASDATSITVSGTIYSDEGSTVIDCSGANNKTVKIEVNNTAQYSGTCTASGGTYSIGSVSVEASDVLTIYIDGATENASRTTRVAASPANITGANLYQNRVIVSYEDSGPITNTNLDNWDSGNDDDVQYTVTTSALTVSAGSKLIVWTGKTFTPGGTVTTTAASNQANPDGDVAIQSSSTLSMGTNALSVGGDYANSGTFSKSTGQTTTFTGTTTGFTIAPGTSSNFDALTFNGAGGGWTINAAQTVDTTLTLTDGAVTIDGDMTVTTSLSVATNKTLTINSAKTLTLAAGSGTSLTLNGTITGAGTLTYKSTMTFPATGTISSILRMDCTDANLTMSARTYGGVVEAYSNGSVNRYVYLGTATSQTLNFSSHVYVIAAGTGTYTLFYGDTYDVTVNITGNFDFTGGGSGTEYLYTGSGTWTFSGNIDLTNGTLGAVTNGTFVMNGNNTTLTGGNQNFNNLTFAPPDGGTINVATNSTYVGGVLTVAENKTVNIASGAVLSPYTTTSTISLAGTISGDGSLTIRSTNVGLTTAGTISVLYIYFRGDLSNQTVPARTYGKAGGQFWFFHAASSNYTTTLGAGTFNIIGSMYIKAQSSGKLTVDGTANDPTVNVAGWLNTYTATTLQELILDGGTWTISDYCYLNSLTLNVSGSHTFKLDAALDGAASLLTGSSIVNNLEISSSGTVTLWEASHTIAGNLVLGGSGTPTVTNSTIVMTGTDKTITGGGKTLNNLTIDPASAGTITLNTSDLTVSTLLTVAASDALTISSDRTLTLSRNNATNSLTLNGTINGPGRLTYRNATANAFPTGGTLAAALITRFDTVNGNLNIPARTDYGAIEAYGGSANARTVTLGTSGSQTITTSSYFYVIADAASPNHVTIQGATYDPTLNVGGDFDFTGTGAASEIVTAPDAAATWTVSGNINLTGGVYTKSAETIVMNGTGTLTTASHVFNNLTINGNGNTVTETGLLYVYGTLTIGGDSDGNDDTLTLDASGSVVVPPGSSVKLWGSETDTIGGSGTLWSTGTTFASPDTNGTISSNVKFETWDDSTTYIPARTFSDATKTVTLYLGDTGAGPATIQANAGALSIAGNLLVSDEQGNGLSADFSQSTTVSIGGNVSTDYQNNAATLIMPNSATMTVGGNFDLTGFGALTHNNSTLLMNGTGGKTITGAGQILYNLTIDPTSAGTITLNTSDLTVSTALTVADNDALSIAGSRTLTLSATSGTSLNLNTTGTISGAGKLIYKSTTKFPSSGTMSSGLQMDATGGNQVIECLGGAGRTFGGAVEIYNGHASTARTTALCDTNSHTVNFSSSVTINGAGGGAITLDANNNDPTVNITGNLTSGTSGGGAETLSMGSGTWTVSGNVDFTNSTASNTTGNTLIMNGDTKTLVGANQNIYNLTIAPPDGGTINVATSNVLHNGELNVASSKTVNINSGGTLTGGILASVTGSGTITGDGIYATYQTGAITYPITTFDVKYIRFMDSYGDQTIPARSYSKAGGEVRIFNWNTNTNSHILGAGTFNIMGDLFIAATSTGPITLNGTTNNPTVNIDGNLTAYTTATAQTINTGDQTWTVGGNINLTSMTLNATSGNTIKMTGTSKTLTPAGSSLYNLEIASGSTNNVTLSGATTVTNDLTITSGSLTAPAADFNVGGDWTNSGTFVEGTGTVTLNGTASSTLDSGCATVSSCTTTNFYNLTINKTGGVGANDNVTLTSNGLRVTSTLTITAGELIQGEWSVQVDTGGSVSIASAGIWTNISTGDLVLGGGFVNAGAVTFNSNNGAQCTDGADSIVITSTQSGTQRAWSGAGTFTIYNVNVTDMTDSAITAYTSTLSNTTWTVGSCGISVSGTVYQSSSETTVFDCNAVNLALRVSVNGAAATGGTCSVVGGTFTVTGVTAPSGADIPVVVYTDNTANPSQKATTATLSSGTGNITGLTLIIDRVVITQQSATAMSNAKLSTGDNGDAGIRYSAVPAVTVESGMELHVLAGKNYSPGAGVDTTATGTAAGPAGDVHIPATATLNMVGSTLNVGGDLTNAGTLTVSSSQSTVMSAIGTGFILTTGGATMGNVTFNGVGGGWTTSGALTVADAMALNDGAVTIDGDTTANTLTVGSTKLLTINSGKTLTLSKTTTGTTLTLDGTITGPGTLVYQNTNTAFPSGGTISSNVQFSPARTTIVIPMRTFGRDVGCIGLTGNSCTFAATSSSPYVTTITGNLSAIDSSTDGITLIGSTNNPNVTIGGSFTATDAGGGVTVSLGSGTWTVGGDFDLSNVTTFTHNSGTLTMNGTGTLTTNSQALNNFTTSGAGTITLASATHTIAGNLNLGTAITPGTSTVVMNGTSKTIDGGGKSLNALQISGTVTLQNTDLTVAGALTVDSSKQLTINSGRTLTNTSATNVNNDGTITGSTGTLLFTSASGGPDSDANSTGTYSSIVRYDTVSGNVPTGTVDARTYGGDVEFYSNIAANRTITFGTGTFAIAGNMKVITGSTQGSSTFGVTGSSINPTINLTGNLTFTKGSAATPSITTGTGTWTVTGNVDLTDGGFTATTNNTLVMNGTANIVGNTKSLYNFTVDGTNTTVTATGGFSVTNALTIGGTSDSNNDTLTINNGVTVTSKKDGSVTLVGSGTDTIDGAGYLTVSNSNLNDLGTLDVSVYFFVGAVVYNASLTMPARTYGGNVSVNVVDDMAGDPYTVSLAAGSSQFNGNLTLNNGSDMIQSDLTFDCDTGDPTVGLTGNFSADATSLPSYIVTMGSGTWTVGGNFDLTNVATFNHNSGALKMTGTNKTITSNGNSLYNVEVDSSSTNNVTMSGATTVSNDLTITSGTLTAPSAAILTVGGNFANSSAFTHNSGTLKMGGTSKSITSGGSTLNNFEVTGGSITQVGALTVAGTFSESAGAFTQAANNNLTVTGSAFSLSNSTTFTKASGTGKLILDGATMTFTDSNGTKQDLGVVDIGASPSTITLASDMSTSSLNINGTDTLNTKGYDVTVTNHVDCKNSAVLDLTDTGPGNEGDGTIMDVGGNWTMSGTLTPGTNSLVFMNSTAANNSHVTVTTGNQAFRDFECKNAGTVNDDCNISGTFTVNGTLTVTDGQLDLNENDPTTDLNGAVTIAAAGDLVASNSATTTMAGNYTNNGLFTDNGGTVTIDGAAQQTLSGTMTGSSDFNNLTVTNASGSDPDSSPSVIFASAFDTAGTFTAATANTKLRFNAGSTYAPTAINLNGQATGTRVYLRSSTPGTTFAFNAGAGSRTVSNMAVKDSSACGANGGSIDAYDGTNLDEGNTPCWFINTLSVSLSANSTNLGTIDANNVSQAGITSTVTTSAASGYVSLVQYDQTLTSGAFTISNTAGGTIVKGENEYGASSSQSGNTIAQWSPTACSTTATTSNATALSTTFQSFAAKASAASSEATTLCLLASTTGSQAPGTYTSTLTLVTTARF